MLNADLIGAFVEIERQAIDDDTLAGFVVDSNSDLTLLHYVGNDYRLDGYCVVRNGDVTACNVFDDQNSFPMRACRLKRVRARRPRGVDLSTWQSVLETVAQHYPLVVLHREATDRDICFVGRYEASSAQTVTLLSISPDAEWGKRTRFRTHDITRLDFGGGYEDALWRVAEEDRMQRSQKSS